MKTEFIIILSVLGVLIAVAVYKFIQFRKSNLEKKKSEQDSKNSLLNIILPESIPNDPSHHIYVEDAHPGFGNGGSFGGGGASASWEQDIPDVDVSDSDGLFEGLGEALSEIGSGIDL